jgi:AcrR family transcriptional regulator
MYKYKNMSRNPGHADRLMLEAAKKIVCEEGCSGLRVRELVKKAGVNLGMFHYHFRNKRRFKRALLQEMYENFFEKITHASTRQAIGCGHESAHSKLRATLLAMGLFVRQEGPFYLALFKDILNDDAEVLAFMEENVHRHIGVISELVEKCQQEGSMATLAFSQILSFLMSSLNMPLLVGEAMSRHERGSKDRIFKYYRSSVLSDEAIAQRIDLALKGLRV